MPRTAWSAKRERQYDHILASEEEAGRSPERAKEIAARTVNKERAAAGETESGSRLSPRGRADQGTKSELYAEARRRRIPGRSTMSKAELARALRDAP